MAPDLEGRLLALPTNIRLGWKWATVTNACKVLITTVKSFIAKPSDVSL
jgi:hypothetical protein